MNTLLLYPIAVPILTGLVCLLTPKYVKGLRETLTILTTLATLGLSIFLFLQPDLSIAFRWLQLTPSLTIGFDLRLSPFARLILVAASIFSLLIGLYSIRFMAHHPRRGEYYAYFLMVLGMTAGVTLADNLVLLLFFWELHGLLLFLMAGLNGGEAVPATTRTLIIAGVGDLSLMLGIGLLWLQTGTLSIHELVVSPAVLNAWMTSLAFLLMSVGAFAKAGAIPLHSWIPAIAPTTPSPIMAYLPASLDKLLGIYLLARVAVNLFVMSPAIGVVLMTIGGITILGAVLMALIQSDYRKMLSYHAVSQVGYMV